MAKKAKTQVKSPRSKDVLKEQGKPQGWLADMINKDLVSVSRYVNGHREPSYEVLYQIAKALKVDPCDLLNR